MKQLFLLFLSFHVLLLLSRAFSSCRSPAHKRSNQLSFFVARHHPVEQQEDDHENDQAFHIQDLKFNVSNLMLLQNSMNSMERLMPVLAGIYEAAVDALHNQEQFPALLSVETLPESLIPMRLFLCNSQNVHYHAGHFRVFSNSSFQTTSLQSNALFSLNDPLSFIHQSLSCRAKDRFNKGGMLCNNQEAIVWCDDSTRAVKYASRVLDDMPLAQLHMGSSFDNDSSIRVQLPNWESIIQTLCNEEDILLEGDRAQCNKKTATTSNSSYRKLQAQDLHVIHSILSSISSDKGLPQPSIQTLVKLIDTAVENERHSLRSTTVQSSESPHLVLVAHSVQASIIATALSKWKDQKILTGSSNMTASRQLQQIEDLLHQSVTIVTFGNVCRNFCDGPAYVHISMYDDDATDAFGVTQRKPTGDGRGAVYLQAWSPFPAPKQTQTSNLRNHDSHNHNAGMVQFLCLVMRINGITSFRDLYNAAKYIDPRSILDINPKNFAIDYGRDKQGDLVIPSSLDIELLPAMIRATGGDEWLWNDYSDDSDDEDFLPDPEEAKVYLEEFFGYSAYEEIYDTCCQSTNNAS